MEFSNDVQRTAFGVAAAAVVVVAGFDVLFKLLAR